MEKMQSDKLGFLNSVPRLRALWMGVLFALTVSGSAVGQQAPVTGVVTSTNGAPLAGVRVRVQGTELRAFTNANGRFSIAAPDNSVLNFTLVGQRAVDAPVAGRTVIDVRMEPVAFLEEVVVTAYTEQRRGDITGAVASVNMESASRQTGASILQRLDATVPGISVASSGSPGSRSTVRIRGISSFQNNDPLYVIDGTPVQDSYINFLNPNDIASVQVLKDASASSIYGSRASNGVIVIETNKRGAAGPPRITARARTGVATPVRGYDDFLILNSLDYFEVLKRSYENAGQAVPTNIYGDPNNPTLPQYTYPNLCTPSDNACTRLGATTDAYGRTVTLNGAAYAYPNTLVMGTSAGTNWWDEVFGSGMVSDYNLDVSGGGEENSYGVSFNYFDQNGTALHNRFKRGSVRLNTAFNRGRLSIGENIALGVERAYGGVGDDSFGEDAGILGKNILMQPIVPVYDAQGNFASGKAVGLGNNTNPVKVAFINKDNVSKNNRVFGNVFAGFQVMPELLLRTRLGVNLHQGSYSGFSPIYPENSEPTFTNSINENQSHSTDWTWSNTLRYVRQFRQHNFDVLLGQEANAATNRFIGAGISNLLSTDVNSRYIQDALGDAASKNVSSSGGRSALLSVFGKADYNFADRYVASFTLRKDGSSRLSPDNQWGTFPAFGLGWRISNEPFMSGSRLISDAMLRFGWGVTGNQAIPSGRIVSQFGGNRGDTYYDIGGSNTSVQPGFRQTSLGNNDLKWEENRSMNVGADLALFAGKINVVVDLYTRETSNLLFDPRLPGTAGIAAPPIVNVGTMRNKGIDFSIGHTNARWNATFQGSHYRNEIVSIDGVQDFFYGPQTTRFGNQIINQVGSPISSFYGLVAEGFFRDAADVAAHVTQNGAAPGRIKFKDVNGDGQITAADRTIIGSPHPDFTAALDLGVRRGNWDLSGTLFGTFGNEIWDAQKEWYVFRNFSTNVRKDLLTDSWTPQNLDAKYPRLDVNDVYSNALSSFYVESGSYVRLRNLQLGYNLPTSMSRWLAASRIYIQGENLFTVTGYDGLDPALPTQNTTGAAGDIRDQYRGIDRGTYPSNKTVSIGIVTSF